MNTDTIAAVATGGVVAAIGIVRISGPDAIGTVDRVFRPMDGVPMARQESRRLVYGRLFDKEGRLIDFALCTVSRAPHSYTGEDTAELQCHGSPVVLREALESLFAAGARQAERGEFTRRAFLNGCMDLSAAEAVIDLIEAESAPAARNAAGQLGGAVCRRVEAVYSSLTDICAHFHAVLDYPDEDIEPFELENYRSTLAAAHADLSRLLDTHARGRLLEKGVSAVLLGKPNAGKSSLLNALLGYDRAIVTAVPGTTRDTLSERVLLGEVLLRLTDTAGLRESADDIEALGVERSRSAAESAELALAVFDTSRPWETEDEETLALAQRCPQSIALLNKSDLPAALDERNIRSAFSRVLRVSAVTGEGLRELGELVEALYPLPAAGGEVLTSERQAEALSRALEALKSAEEGLEALITPDAVLTDVEAAMAALGELTGRNIRLEVTDRIFARFCVGK